MNCDACRRAASSLHPRPNGWICTACLPKTDDYHKNRARLEAKR